MNDSMESPPLDNVDTRTAFRKPSNDAANRKYRRRSLANDGSSSSDGSPERNCSPSPRGDVRKVSEPHHAKRDDRRESDRDSSRSRYGSSGDSYRHDRFSSRDAHHYSKRDDYSRHERDGDENGRRYRMSPSQSSRDSRSGHHSDRRRVEAEHSRSRNDVDRHSRDKYSSSGHRSKDKERAEDLSSDRAGSGRRHADSRSDGKEKDYLRNRYSLDERRDSRWSSGDRHSRDEKREYEECEINKEKDVYFKCPRDRSEDKTGFANDNQDTPSKKLKGLSSEKFTDGETDGGKQPSSSKPTLDIGAKGLPAQSQPKESGISGDLDAAKVAAMKAAELVNRNLVGTGQLTTDQKKKLLWGNKKNTAVEESAHRWDTALIGDHERQEKFNKLMGVRGNIKPEQKPNDQEVQAEKQKELQLDLEKQYTAGLRRRDGRTVGLGL